MYRLTRTVVSGQFENDSCFRSWIAALPTSSAALVKWYDEPAPTLLSSPEANPKRVYLWNQLTPVTTPKCPKSDPDLINRDGRKGWETLAEAESVFSALLAEAKKWKADIQVQVAEAFNPNKIAVGAAGELAKDTAKAAATAAEAAGKAVGITGPWLVIGGVVVGAGALYLIFRK